MIQVEIVVDLGAKDQKQEVVVHLLRVAIGPPEGTLAITTDQVEETTEIDCE